jgi:hypothetical protein
MTELPDHDPVVERFQRVYATTLRPARSYPAHRHRGPTPWLLGLAAAAAILFVLRIPMARSAVGVPPADSLVTVEFVLVRDAEQVAVVGDFNGWDPSATPMNRDGPGRLWHASAQVGVGRTEYAFVLDGQTWIPDPNAPLAAATEFGTRNSVLTIHRNGSL